MNLATPTNQNAEVLHELLINDYITFKSNYIETGIINLTARLSNLRIDYGLEIPCVNIETRNKFGRKINYGSWKLIDKEQGRIIYSKINRK